MKYVVLAAAVAALAAGCGSTKSAGTVSVPKCPAHPPHLTSHGLTASHFVDPGAQLIRLCRYDGANSSNPGGLASQSEIRDAATVSRITREFNALQPPPRGIFCPLDDGSALLVEFGYPGAAPERVTVALSGCRFAWNGQASRSMSAALSSLLLASA